MTDNLLITGPPRSGKTTVIERVRDRLEDHGYSVGGIHSQEVRSDGERVGFDIVDMLTGDARTMAHVEREDGPRVGKYRVDVEAVEAICSSAFSRAFDRADVQLVDEIAPMEVHSDAFVSRITRALDADLPLVAAIHYRTTTGFIGEVKDREDTEIFDVSQDTRDDRPATLTERLRRSV